MGKIPSERMELLELIRESRRLSLVHEAILKKESDGDSAHDLAHLYRVAFWACRILNRPEQNESAIAAALLHDLVNVPKNHPDRSRASEFSAKEAVPILKKAGFSEEETDKICTAIRQHSFSSGEKPVNALAQSLQDADRLEALGAIGIMRCYSTGARMGTRYFHPSDPWAKDRSLNDSAYSLDHFFTKLLLLPDSMNTSAGRAEAEERAKTMRDFLEGLGEELGERCPEAPRGIEK